MARPAALERPLAAIEYRHPLFKAAVRLRVHWRLEGGAVDEGAEDWRRDLVAKLAARAVRR